MSGTAATSDAEASKRPALPASSKSIGDYFKVENDGANFSDIECQQISKLLLANDEVAFSQVPRLYIVLRLVGQISILPKFIDLGLNDLCFPFNSSNLPKALSPSYQREFLQLQHRVHTKGLALENSEQRHVHFSKGELLPLVAKEKLGEGGYGSVDKVESQLSGRILARKRFLRRGLASTTELKSFLTEINNMKKIHHQHCVEFVASYTDSRYFALLMLPVAECDLEAYYSVALSDPSHIPRLRAFFGCLISAMSHLHNDVKIRHRDVKPKNILVKGENVYLTDFGISLDWEQLSRSTTTADTGKSWIYCAPEVANYEPRNSSSDVWSLGCVFLEMYSVIRGNTVASMREVFRQKTGTYRFYENANFIPQYLQSLSAPEDSPDNAIYEWIVKMIQTRPNSRASSKELYELICGTSAKKHFACDNCAIVDYDDDVSSGTDADDESLNDWVLSGAGSAMNGLNLHDTDTSTETALSRIPKGDSNTNVLQPRSQESISLHPDTSPPSKEHTQNILPPPQTDLHETLQPIQPSMYDNTPEALPHNRTSPQITQNKQHQLTADGHVKKPFGLDSNQASGAQKTLCVAFAMWQYDAREINEISFEKADRINVLVYETDDWWYGQLTKTGETGLFPSNHVKKDILFTATVVDSFTGRVDGLTGEADPECLVMKPLDMIQVLHCPTVDWWRGRNESSGEEGFFPPNCVERSPPLIATTTPLLAPVQPEELMVTQGDSIQVLSHTTNRAGWWWGRNDNTGQEGSFNSSWFVEDFKTPLIQQKTSLEKDMDPMDGDDTLYPEDAPGSEATPPLKDTPRSVRTEVDVLALQQYSSPLEKSLLVDLAHFVKPWPRELSVFHRVVTPWSVENLYGFTPPIPKESWQAPSMILSVIKQYYAGPSGFLNSTISKDFFKRVSGANVFDLYSIFVIMIANGFTLEQLQPDHNSFHPLHHLLSTEAWQVKPKKESPVALERMWKAFKEQRSTSNLTVDKEKSEKRKGQEVEAMLMTTMSTLIFVRFVESATTIDTLIPRNSTRQSTLHMAIQASNLPAVSCLLEKGWPIDRHMVIYSSTGKESSYALTFACMMGSFEIVKALLGKGANINQADINGWKPAFAALYRGHSGVLDHLLSLGAALEAPPSESLTIVEPFMVAVNMGNSDTVKVLLKHGRKPEYPHPLMNPIRNGDLPMIKVLLRNDIVGKSSPQHLRRAARAAKSESRETLVLLRQKYGDPTLPD